LTQRPVTKLLLLPPSPSCAPPPPSSPPLVKPSDNQFPWTTTPISFPIASRTLSFNFVSTGRRGTCATRPQRGTLASGGPGWAFGDPKIAQTTPSPCAALCGVRCWYKSNSCKAEGCWPWRPVVTLDTSRRASFSDCNSEWAMGDDLLEIKVPVKYRRKIYWGLPEEEVRSMASRLLIGL